MLAAYMMLKVALPLPPCPPGLVPVGVVVVVSSAVGTLSDVDGTSAILLEVVDFDVIVDVEEVDVDVNAVIVDVVVEVMVDKGDVVEVDEVVVVVVEVDEEVDVVVEVDEEVDVVVKVDEVVDVVVLSDVLVVVDDVVVVVDDVVVDVVEVVVVVVRVYGHGRDGRLLVSVRLNLKRTSILSATEEPGSSSAVPFQNL
jgi:hypothetical protein